MYMAVKEGYVSILDYQFRFTGTVLGEDVRSTRLPILIDWYYVEYPFVIFKFSPHTPPRDS
jgi:hypothetical protein